MDNHHGMWGNSTARVEQMFVDQFEADGLSFQYRKSLRGRGVKVSLSERDAFVAEFRRGLRWLIWGLVGAVITVLGIVIAIDISIDREPRQWEFLLIILPFVPIYLILWRRLWSAPERALSSRPTNGIDRSKKEAKELYLQRMTWGQMFGGGALLCFLALKMCLKEDLTVGWSRLWIVFFAACLAAFVVQAYRKWRLENRANR